MGEILLKFVEIRLKQSK